MENNSKIFMDAVKPYYESTPNTICLGGILYNDQLLPDLFLNIPLKSLNRHGLIAGATGTGKTKTIQMLSEQLAEQGIPTLLMDIKGDLSGLGMPGHQDENILNRQKMLHLDYTPTSYPIEFLAMGEQPGVKVRETLLEFGPMLFAKMLDLNETQTSVLTILFQYAKDQGLTLIDLSDIKQLLAYAQGPGKSYIEAEYGGLASASVKSILRNIIELESQGGAAFFGEPSFDVHDLLQMDVSGKGIISILRLLNLQDKPKLFSSFMLGLLNLVYSKFPEVGDPDKPKLIIFIDEAHLIFNQASKALLEQLENMVKLIRSKGIGLIFCTQSPDDIPEGVLGQLGLKIQHALRAFTAKDRKAIKLAAENFPLTIFYDTASLLTSLGTGQALVSALDTRGQPTPLVAGLIRAPQSRLGPLTENEIMLLLMKSNLVNKYEHRLERESAREKLTQHPQAEEQIIPQKKPSSKSTGTMETLSKNTLFRQIIRSIVSEITKAIMNLLGMNKRKR